MTTHSSNNYDFSLGRLTVTKAQLNPPFFIPSDNIFAVMLKNNGDTPLSLQKMTFACEGFIEGSAVMFVKRERITLEATETDGKITVYGIYIPPRENVIVFYRMRAEG